MRIKPMSEQTINSLAPYLSYGAIGLGLALFIVFVILSLNSKLEKHSYVAATVCIIIFLGGVFIEYERMIEHPEGLVSHNGECIKEDGSFGSVILRIKVFNEDRTEHGYNQDAKRSEGIWLISNIKFENISSSSRLTKRFGASWKCD
jgi:hypothetical protein